MVLKNELYDYKLSKRDYQIVITSHEGNSIFYRKFPERNQNKADDFSCPLHIFDKKFKRRA